MSFPCCPSDQSAALASLLGEGWALPNKAGDQSTISMEFLDEFQELVDAGRESESHAVRIEEGPFDAALHTSPARKRRKCTNTVRKEEKAALEAEIRALEAQLDALRFTEIVQRGEVDPSFNSKKAQNALLWNIIQDHHLVLASSQAMLVASYTVRPADMYIHLAADETVRHKDLSALKEPKLLYARRFITQTSHGLHPSAEYFKEERFETPEGDCCNVRFDRTALRGIVGGVRAVFDAIKHAVFNAEIVLSEASGNITIREDDFTDDTEHFSQMRLVAQTACGVPVENNLVHFSELVDDSYALATADFVDEDERFPYRPKERIRRDATAIALITSHKEPAESAEPVVVLTRWTFTRIHATELNVPTQTLRAMRDVSISDATRNCVKETLKVNLPHLSYALQLFSDWLIYRSHSSQSQIASR